MPHPISASLHAAGFPQHPWEPLQQLRGFSQEYWLRSPETWALTVLLHHSLGMPFVQIVSVLPACGLLQKPGNHWQPGH